MGGTGRHQAARGRHRSGPPRSCTVTYLDTYPPPSVAGWLAGGPPGPGEPPPDGPSRAWLAYSVALALALALALAVAPHLPSWRVPSPAALAAPALPPALPPAYACLQDIRPAGYVHPFWIGGTPGRRKLWACWP